MAIANLTTRSTGTQGASAEPADKFDSATLKLDGARALVTMFGIFAGEAESLPVSGGTIHSAMSGIDLLIESAIDDLLAGEGSTETTAT